MPRVRSARIRTRFLRSALLATATVSASLFAAATPAAGQVAGQTVGEPACARSAASSSSPSTTRCRASASASIRRPRARRSAASSSSTRTVFSSRDWYFQLFNIFHRTTRDVHHRARAADQARAALRPGAGRGEHAQPAVAAGARRRGPDAAARPSCRASSSIVADRRRRCPGRSICWWSRATSGACASTPTSSTRATR